MRKMSLMILAIGMAAGVYTPASAQLNIDCGNPQNALSDYCRNRGQFVGVPGPQPAPMYPAGEVMDDPVTTGSIMAAPPVVAAPAGPNIDCGVPQNAITYYCMNRDQFR